MEPESEPNITRGVLDGVIRPGPVTIFRLQSAADTELRSYVAEGEVRTSHRSRSAPSAYSPSGMGRFTAMSSSEKASRITRRWDSPTRAKRSGTHSACSESRMSFNRPRGMLYQGESPF